jgi:hypothetical protein
VDSLNFCGCVGIQVAARMRTLCALALCLFLSGCWFVYIPGDLVSKASDAVTGDKGDNCVRTSARLGDSIYIQGKGNGTVVGLSGKSSRCTNQFYPIRADLVFTE